MVIKRVTLSLDEVDVDLIDRLARLQGINRSEQFRQFLGQARPMVRQTVQVMESALEQRDELLSTFSAAEIAGLEELMPEINHVQDAVLGSMARLEGRIAAHDATGTEATEQDETLMQAFGRATDQPLPPRPDPRPSNHGGHTLTPPSEKSTE